MYYDFRTNTELWAIYITAQKNRKCQRGRQVRISKAGDLINGRKQGKILEKPKSRNAQEGRTMVKELRPYSAVD